jgi:hypothetical protein
VATLTADLCVKDWSRRNDELLAQYQWAVRRNAELVDKQDSIRRRRAEVRASRLRLQSEVHARLGERRAIVRAAAAFLEAAVGAADISFAELWIDYFGLGGERTPHDLAAMIEGRTPIDSHTHDVLAVALNERLIDKGFAPLLAFWDEIPVS